MFKQLPLGITLPEHFTFDNFVAGENHVVLDTLQDICAHKIKEQHLYLWGQKGVGRTHLLQAACYAAANQELRVSYIPLQLAHEFNPELLNDMHTLQLIAVDDVNAIAGNADWEHALFRLYQRALETNARIIWSADAPPSRLNINLKDLQSRLSASLVLQIEPLSDSDKLIALQQRASERGLELPDAVGHYLLAHCPRQMNELFSILDKLDHAALVAQRALTIPFVKQVLDL